MYHFFFVSVFVPIHIGTISMGLPNRYKVSQVEISKSLCISVSMLCNLSCIYHLQINLNKIQ